MMKNQPLLLIISLILVLFGFTQCKENKEKESLPNVVIIFTDDQGYADLSCYGAEKFETPNIDKLATEGVRFTDFYASQAVCSSSRSSLLTGCYAERVSISGALMPFSRVGLNPNEETIADLLKKKDYATAIFGKWHLGQDTSFLPQKQGFDEFVGLPYSNDMWPVNFDGTPCVSKRKRGYPKLNLIDGDEKITEIKDLDDQATLTTIYTEQAVDFIKKNSDKPFFLYVPHSMPHVPIAVSEKFKGKSEQGLFGDVMMEIDWSVGEILKTLKECGVEDNTIVIFASDNGPWLNFGNHAGSAAPLREGKGSMWEGGPRVPCIMRWPGKIPQSTVCNKMASTIDILPTIAAITDIQMDSTKIDGVNILPLLLDEKDANPRETFYYYYCKQLRAVRHGDWKLYFPHKYRSYEDVEPGNDGFPGKYNYKKCGLELYNLKTDISETENVPDKYPEIVEKLEKLAEKARYELGDELRNQTGVEVREPGRLKPKQGKVVKHKAVGKPVTMKKSSHKSYKGEGAASLVNGFRGSFDCKDGQWLGYWGEDFEATVDLEKVDFIKSVNVSFLQDQPSWIFFPEKITISTSTDGKVYKNIETQFVKLSDDNELEYKSFNFAVENSVRFIKIDAKNIGKCPPWIATDNGDAWLFIDEIVIK